MTVMVALAWPVPAASWSPFPFYFEGFLASSRVPIGTETETYLPGSHSQLATEPWDARLADLSSRDLPGTQQAEQGDPWEGVSGGPAEARLGEEGRGGEMPGNCADTAESTFEIFISSAPRRQGRDRDLNTNEPGTPSSHPLRSCHLLCDL